MSSRTWIVRSDRLKDPQVASVVLRLMMAINDSSLANNALHEWSQSEERTKKNRMFGGKIYFARVQLGHVYEALLVIEEMLRSDKLTGLVGATDSGTQAAFKKLEAFVGSDDYHLLLRLRNNLSFHYDRKLAIRALERILIVRPDDISPMSVGSEVLHWHFLLADKVSNSIFARDVLRLAEEETNVTAEADKIIHRMFDVHEVLGEFAIGFIRHCFAK
ncbi:MAG: hypothetical protein M5U07_14070 [Xanthobacteraceae bacterium]|nr:hypothetical protein [Xanthobacteraceae bacterium]